MPTLTRRRSDDPHRESWRVFYGDEVSVMVSESNKLGVQREPGPEGTVEVD